ncbi:fibrobacter succinogenes major paralogous domain-containing protein [soil metagenome]
MKQRNLLLISIALIFSIDITAQETGSFTDARDGKEYKTVTIGNQTWMAENLAYKATSECWAYNNNETNVKMYGYLYSWDAAQKVAPAGWHLASDKEWKKLTDFLGGVFNGGEKLKAAKSGEGTGRNSGTNESGFNGIPAGRYALGKFEGIGVYWVWWTSTKKGKYLAYDRSMKFDEYWMGQGLTALENGHSVRCIKD